MKPFYYNLREHLIGRRLLSLLLAVFCLPATGFASEDEAADVYEMTYNVVISAVEYDLARAIAANPSQAESIIYDFEKKYGVSLTDVIPPESMEFMEDSISQNYLGRTYLEISLGQVLSWQVDRLNKEYLGVYDQKPDDSSRAFQRGASLYPVLEFFKRKYPKEFARIFANSKVGSNCRMEHHLVEEDNFEFDDLECDVYKAIKYLGEDFLINAFAGSILDNFVFENENSQIAPDVVAGATAAKSNSFGMCEMKKLSDLKKKLFHTKEGSENTYIAEFNQELIGSTVHKELYEAQCTAVSVRWKNIEGLNILLNGSVIDSVGNIFRLRNFDFMK